MKKAMYILVLCFIVMLVATGCGEREEGIDSSVTIGGEKLVVKSVSETSEYTDSVLSTINKSIIPTSSTEILIVVEGIIKSKADQDLCDSPSMRTAFLEWYGNSLVNRQRAFMCRFDSEEKSFVLVFPIPKERTNLLLYLVFPKDDISINVWKLSPYPPYQE